MKKRYRSWNIGAAALACSILFAGCRAAGDEQMLATIQEETQNGQSEQGGVSLANPWRDMTEEEMIQVTGAEFRLPSGAQNVHYRYMESEKLAEAVFEWTDLVFTARKQPESGYEDISGMYYDWVLEDDIKIGVSSGKNCVAIAEGNKVNVCSWYDAEEGMMYSLSVIAADLDGFDITALAGEMAGVAEGVNEAVVYEGTYLDDDTNSPALEITKGDDGTYQIHISIVRLTDLDDGVGEPAADGLHFTATDAAGNPIKGLITVDEDSAKVVFTDSKWDLIQNGDTFTYHKAAE